MFRILRTLLSLVAVVILAPVLSYLTAFIVVGHDSSQEATVGDIRLQGFPIWFQESAPGYSVVDGWHSERFLFNTLVFGAVLIGVALLTIRFLNKKADSRAKN